MSRMASDLCRTATVERDIEQAFTALKKGAYLLKYGRRGKPKFYPFRLSNPIFQQYPRLEKEYQSFSLIYNGRSLDLICKDKDEAEAWFSGLKSLISRCHHAKVRTESRSDGISSEATSPSAYKRRSSPLHSPFSSNDSLQKV